LYTSEYVAPFFLDIGLFYAFFIVGLIGRPIVNADFLVNIC